MFKVLEIGDQEWLGRLAALPPERRDVHFNPRMLAVYTAVMGWKAGLAVTDENGDFILQPVLLTKENQVRHAYNFGGPVANNDTSQLETKHRFNLIKWMGEQGASREYCTLNPFLAEHQRRLCGSAKYIKDVVWLDLTKPFQLRGTTRRLANKAVGENGVVVKEVLDENLELFHKMYNTTMERHSAAEHWRLPLEYFKALCRLTQSAVLMATVKGEPESMCILVTGMMGPAYYHFQGSFGNHPSSGVNHALVLAAAERAKGWGCQKFHLGGGVTPAANDSLLTFKSGFSPLRAPVFTYETYVKKETQTAA